MVGDADRLRQVVDNLLVNAVRHTPAGTPIEVDLRQRRDSAVVSVSRPRAGDPGRRTPRIFEPFYRSDPSRSRATGGQGLGLAIVETIVQAHGGQVGVGEARAGERGSGSGCPSPRRVRRATIRRRTTRAPTSTARLRRTAPDRRVGSGILLGRRSEPTTATVPVVDARHWT